MKRVFGGFYEFGWNEKRSIIGGYAHVFLQESLVIGAGVADEVEVFGVIHELTRVVRRQFLLEFKKKALVERVFECDSVVRDGFGIFVKRDLLDEAIEKVVSSAVGGDDFELSAPGDAGVGDGVEELGIGMESKLIE